VTALDKQVKKMQKNTKEQSNSIFPVIEPWHEPVNGECLLEAIKDLINRFMAFPSEHEVTAIALHIIHTHCIEAAECSPILNISSPEKRCGKSTLISVLQRLVNRPLVASSISPAAVFRAIEKWEPSLILDEADSFMRDNEEMRGVINSGHTRDSAYVIRCVGDDNEPTRFNTWCPKIIAGIGHLPETIEDRSIIIQLRRKHTHEVKDKLRDIAKSVFDELHRKCIRFAADNIKELKKITPQSPTVLNDRAADNWMALLVIAELAGGKWLEMAKDAAIYLSGNKQEPISIGVELLQDIKTIFDTKKVDRLSTSELLDALCSEAEASWATYNRGKPLSAKQLANRLKEYKIQSKDIRIPPHMKNLKGYYYSDFSEAFSRYISSPSPDLEATAATALQSPICAGSSPAVIPDVADKLSDNPNILNDVALTYPRQTQNVADEKTLKPLSGAGCSVVADKSAVLEGAKENIGNRYKEVCNKCSYIRPFCLCK
jgi:putative DNA primase/helicase